VRVHVKHYRLAPRPSGGRGRGPSRLEAGG
jgi:hypothetical protein